MRLGVEVGRRVAWGRPRGANRVPASAVVRGIVGALGVLALLATLTTWRWALSPHRTWSADASVVFLAPVPKTDNPFTWFPKNAQYVAETAALEVSSDASRRRIAPGATTYDARLVNVGSQWVPVHDRPTVAVQVAGPDPDSVVAVRAAVVDQLVRAADRQQAALGTPPQNRISSTIFGVDTPATPTSGRRSRGAAMLLVLTVALWVTFLRVTRRALQPVRSIPAQPAPGAEVDSRHPEQLVAIGGASEDRGR